MAATLKPYSPHREINAELPAVSPWMLRWFCGYVPRYLRRHFSVVRLLGSPPDTADPRAMLVYCNHPAWWDPLAIVLLISLFFRHRPGYGPIDVKGLRRYRFLEKLGFFGIDLQSRAGATRFLQVGSRVLATPGQTLWVTAEGHFTDARKRPVVLRKGVAHLARRASRAAVTDDTRGAVAVPLAMEYGFGPERRPELRLCFGEPIELMDPARTTADWDRGLADSLQLTMDRLASASIALLSTEGTQAKHGEGFTTLLESGRGMGGIYGFWQRVSDGVQGKRHEPTHTGATR